MIKKPSILVGIRKTVRRFINHPWFVAIAGSIIAGMILYILLDRSDILAEIKGIMSGSVTISILWIITITACVIFVVIAYYILLRRNKTHTKDRPTKKKTSREISKSGIDIPTRKWDEILKRVLRGKQHA